MKIPRLGFFGLIILALAFAAPPAEAQTGEELYQQALVLERSNGEVREAIQLYERIVRDFASQRALAARALLRLGMAHEILGNAEARAAYQRLVADFGDQEDLVDEARTRLAALSPTSPDDPNPVSRLLFTDGEGCSVYWMRASPDGSRVAWTNICGEGEITVRNVATGVVRRLTRDGGYGSPVWSRDGERLMSMKMGEGLRIFDVRSGADRTPAGARDLRISPVDWNADGDHVATGVTGDDGGTSPAVISISDGDTLILAENLHQGAGGARFSPDGRFVAFKDYVGETMTLFVSRIDGSERTQVADEAGVSPGRPLWSPDGSVVMYQRGSGWWATPMEAGRPAGPAFPVRAEESHWPIDWTERGLFHAEENIVSEAWEIPVDPETGRVTGSEQRLPGVVEGDALWMAWSPDMTILAMAYWDNTLRLYSRATGAVTEYPMGPEFLPSHIWWSGDGSEVLFTTAARARRDKRSTVFALDPATGAVRELLPRMENAHHLHLSSDGRKVVFITNLMDREQTQELVIADAGRREGLILDTAPGPDGRFSGRYGQPLLSPDGSKVLYLRTEGAPGAGSGYTSTLWVAASDGSTPPRRLLSRAGGFFVGFTWSPDGNSVAFLEVDMESEEGALSVISTETGERRDLRSSLPFPRGGAASGVNLKYWSPDGRSIGIVRASGQLELWLTPLSPTEMGAGGGL